MLDNPFYDFAFCLFAVLRENHAPFYLRADLMRARGRAQTQLSPADYERAIEVAHRANDYVRCHH